MTWSKSAPNWTDPKWLAEAESWIDLELSRLALAPTEPIEQWHLRPWSTVLRASTGQGDFYFKATTPVLADEARLLPALAHWWPDRLPQVVASDVERGWLLMRDGGSTLRGLVRQERHPGRWLKILPAYAELQQDMARRQEQLLALGVMDRRLEVLPSLFGALLAQRDALRLDRPDGLTREEFQQLTTLEPRFADLCLQLAGRSIPQSLNHGDFHGNNIFVSEKRCIFVDWGDACIAHPFMGLLVTLRSVAYHLELDDDDPWLDRLRDAYLEAWAGYGSYKSLLATLSLANTVEMINRALTWHQAVYGLDGPPHEEFAEGVIRWLRDFLDAVTN